MKYLILFMLFCICKSSVYSQTITAFNRYLTNSNQVLFVKILDVNSIQGNMFLYERKNKRRPWRLVDSFAVVVGQSGLGKDPNAIIPMQKMPEKREGDGKSPAGIFPLGNVFSYHNLNHLSTSFKQVNTSCYCVDDTASSYYNKLIVKDTAKEQYSSFETMKRNDDLYEYGIWVLYNSKPVVSSNGSCIFLHVWRDANTGTTGCTAMDKTNIIKLINWLNRRKNPVLLQLPEQKN